MDVSTHPSIDHIIIVPTHLHTTNPTQEERKTQAILKTPGRVTRSRSKKL